MTGLGDGLVATGGAAAGLSLQSQISILSGQIAAINLLLLGINANFSVIREEIETIENGVNQLDTQVQSHERSINDISYRVSNISTDPTMTFDYKGQHITVIEDTTYIKGDIIIDGRLKQTIKRTSNLFYWRS